MQMIHIIIIYVESKIQKQVHRYYSCDIGYWSCQYCHTIHVSNILNI